MSRLIQRPLQTAYKKQCKMVSDTPNSDRRRGAWPNIPLGIDPSRLYEADDLRRLWNASEKLARQMERAGFVWHRVAWRERSKFALGSEIIDFIKNKRPRRPPKKG